MGHIPHHVGYLDSIMRASLGMDRHGLCTSALSILLLTMGSDACISLTHPLACPQEENVKRKEAEKEENKKRSIEGQARRAERIAVCLLCLFGWSMLVLSP